MDIVDIEYIKLMLYFMCKIELVYLIRQDRSHTNLKLYLCSHYILHTPNDLCVHSLNNY